MSQILNTGPGSRTRSTKVSRLPFWKKAEQEWIFLPVDKTHNQQVVEEDREGNNLGTINLYESKGWMPLRYMADNEAAMAKLPVNWQEVANHGADPEYAEKVPAKAGKQAGGEF